MFSQLEASLLSTGLFCTWMWLSANTMDGVGVGLYMDVVIREHPGRCRSGFVSGTKYLVSSVEMTKSRLASSLYSNSAHNNYQFDSA